MFERLKDEYNQNELIHCVEVLKEFGYTVEKQDGRYTPGEVMHTASRAIEQNPRSKRLSQVLIKTWEIHESNNF